MFKKLKVYKLQGLADVMDAIPHNQNIIGRGIQSAEANSGSVSTKKGGLATSNLGGIGKRGGAYGQIHYHSRTSNSLYSQYNVEKGYLPKDLDKMPRH